MRQETIGDCMLYLGNAYDILPLLGKIDVLVTDPPYEFDTAGKRFIGIEWDERFFELAVRRIRAAYDQMDMFIPRGGEMLERQEVMI